VLSQPLVNFILSPKCLQFGLAFSGVGPHLKRCLRQQNCLFITLCVCHNLKDLDGQLLFKSLSEKGTANSTAFLMLPILISLAVRPQGIPD
jgi:hypothetical protein